MTLFNWNNAKLTTQADEVAHALERFTAGDLSGTFHGTSALAVRVTPAIHGLQDKLVQQRSDATAHETAATAHETAATALSAALVEMMKAHAAGAIDAVIAVDTLPEPYCAIAQNINALVQSHIDVKMRVVDVVTKYAEGDFAETMDRLPGKKAQITEAMDRAKASFESNAAQAAEATKFLTALAEVSKQHQLGWIDEVIPVDNFNGSFRRAAELVNSLVRAHIDVKMKVVEVIMKYAAGDFSVSMDRLPGKKAQITQALDEAKATFESVAKQASQSERFISALGEMTKQHDLGWLDEQIAVEDFDGVYQHAAQMVNSLVRSHINVKMKIVEIVTRYAHNDFSVAMDRLPGKKALITEAIDGVRTLLQSSDHAIHDVTRMLSALAVGDLTQTITDDYGDGPFRQLKDDANATVESLSKTVVEIKVAAGDVSLSAREIASGNGDLSMRTEEQAASLETTAASMEELTATVHQNTENAKQANVLAMGASTIAVKGGRVVGEVVETMAAINASAKKIVDIISVIDGIAFQTNILALNAAVEAARAGEQGRGFAVVAGEVRTLAQRSAAAAKEIKGLIGDSVDKTTAGSKLVDEAGQTMAEIVASVKRVTDIMAAIASASQEQGSGIELVNTALAQMDQVTQQNAALVEQIAASAEGLEQRATSLVALVGVFRLNEKSGNFSAQAPAPPRAVHALPKSNAHKPKPAAAVAGRALAESKVSESNWNSF